MKKLLIALIAIMILFSCGKDMRVNNELEDYGIEHVDSTFLSEIELADFKAYGKEVEFLVVHTMANTRDWSLKDINNFWSSIGWKNPGYHIIVNRNGSMYIQKPINDNILTYGETTNGVRGRNSYCLHISWQGGYVGDDRTDVQKAALRNALILLKAICSNAKIVGHNYFPEVAKACPWFDAEEEYKDLNEI